MTKFIAQGIVLSNVACHNERRKAAQRLGLSLDEVPLKYGSIRMAVNQISIDDVVYEIDKTSSDENIKESRLILEISYKFDEEANVVEAHEVINEMYTKESYMLVMSGAFVSRNHHMKFIQCAGDEVIQSYFIKSWADRIEFLSTPELKDASDTITPREVVKAMCLDKDLIIA